MPTLRPKQQTLKLLFIFIFCVGASFNLNEAFSQDDADSEELARRNFGTFGDKSPEETRKMFESLANGKKVDASEFEKMKKEFESEHGDLNEKLKEIQESGQKLPGGIDPAAIMKMMENGGKDATPEQKRAMEQSTLKMVDMALSQYRNRSQKEVEAFILSQVKGKKVAHKILENNPKLLKFIAAQLRHESALTDLFSIVFTKPRFYYYAGCMIGTILLGWLIKWRMNKKGAKTFGQGLRQTIGRMVFVLSLRLGVTIYFWHEQLAPSYHVFKDSFFS